MVKARKRSETALHLRPSPSTVRRVNNLIDVVSAYAFKGAAHPDVQDELEKKYADTNKRFMAFLASLEARAKKNGG